MSFKWFLVNPKKWAFTLGLIEVAWMQISFLQLYKLLTLKRILIDSISLHLITSLLMRVIMRAQKHTKEY